MATCGSPVRSTAPDMSEERMMTMPTSASRAVKLSWVMVETCFRGGSPRQRGRPDVRIRHIPQQLEIHLN
jgi:hypothetical protein